MKLEICNIVFLLVETTRMKGERVVKTRKPWQGWVPALWDLQWRSLSVKMPSVEPASATGLRILSCRSECCSLRPALMSLCYRVEKREKASSVWCFLSQRWKKLWKWSHAWKLPNSKTFLCSESANSGNYLRKCCELKRSKQCNDTQLNMIFHQHSSKVKYSLLPSHPGAFWSIAATTHQLINHNQQMKK